MANMRSGFTMIELIFVILIIGILAAIAIPKLAATRDDARIATELNDIATCITSAGSVYTATGNMEQGIRTPACKHMKCLEAVNNLNNLTLSNSDNSSGRYAYCLKVRKSAEAKGLIGTQVFAGTGISYNE